ncbi:MAG: 30S ribosome-binding factor RbfA [Acidobacteriota bacterium]|nr:30S ribosome-binding factor RbfA [Acidobacteriota bacterium]
MSRRTDRVSEQVRDELNRLVLRDVSDPRVGLARVSRVEVTGDLQHAHVYVSALGDDEERDGCVDALVHARGYLRSRLAANLSLRRTPELHFILDRATDYSLEVTKLLSDVES